jgi:hypothetical protein
MEGTEQKHGWGFPEQALMVVKREKELLYYYLAGLKRLEARKPREGRETIP